MTWTCTWSRESKAGGVYRPLALIVPWPREASFCPPAMDQFTLAEAPEASLALSWSVVVVSMVAFSALMTMRARAGADRGTHGSAACGEQQQKRCGGKQDPQTVPSHYTIAAHYRSICFRFSRIVRHLAIRRTGCGRATVRISQRERIHEITRLRKPRIPIPPKMVSDTSRAKMISSTGMGTAGRESRTQTLAHVHDGVDQHHLWGASCPINTSAVLIENLSHLSRQSGTSTITCRWSFPTLRPAQAGRSARHREAPL